MENINLIKKFFKSLRCEIKESEKGLEISKIPKDFQEFYKVEPYNLDFSNSIQIKEFLSIIKKYLDKSRGTSLLKIEFDIDPLKEISKYLSLKNCKLSNVIQKHKNNSFVRFTFLTTFRYLNETKQAVNDIYIHKGKIVAGDLSNYKITQGKKSETSDIEKNRIENDFKFAKEHLKDLLQQDLEEISNELNKMLDSEIVKVKGHFQKYINETGDKLKERLKKLQELQFESFEENKGKINRILEGIEKIENQNIPQKIKKEEEFVIKDLRQKHSLSIENKLINTTIIYYPLFILNFILKNEKAKSAVKIIYNPLTKEINKPRCYSCSCDLNIFCLCSSGHIVCQNCISRCGDCGKEFCLKCLENSCDKCGKKLCKDCMKKCPECGVVVCKDDIREDALTGEERCINCLVVCSKCHKYVTKENAIKGNSGELICNKCLGKEREKKILKDIFKNS